MTLTKADICEHLSSNFGINKGVVQKFVDCFFEEIRQNLEAGHSIRLSGFGNFNLRDKRQRPGRNPKTGETVAVSPRRVVTFRAGQKLRIRVDGYADTVKN